MTLRAWRNVIDDIARMAQSALDARVAKAQEAHPMTDGVLAYGEPSSQTLLAARDLGADLIVMGTHGRQGIARVLLATRPIWRGGGDGIGAHGSS